MGGKTLQKRDLTIVDDSGSEVKLTLWGDKATTAYPWDTLPIIAVKGVKVGDYGGRSLSTMNSSSLQVNPDIPEGHALYHWKSQFPDGQLPSGASLSVTGGLGGVGGGDAFEKRKHISSIMEEGLGRAEKPDYITVKGTVTYLKHDNDPWYTACPTPNCNKKVVEGMGGQWSCEKCNQHFDNVSLHSYYSLYHCI
jgi:replication factor A1